VVDLRSKGAITDLPKSLVYTIVPHVVSMKEPQDVSGDGRQRNVHIVDRGSVHLAVVCGAING
jgi:hypothetical protein